MKIAIEITVAVDPDEWADTYGIANDPASIRDDVRQWATSNLSHHPDGLVELVKAA
jgi:hypothetical protein